MRQVNGNKVVELIRDSERTFVGTGEIAEQFDVSRQTVRNHREALRMHPGLRVDNVGRATVYYLADGVGRDDTADQPAGGLFDRAGGGAMASVVAFVGSHTFVGPTAAAMVAVAALGIATYLATVAILSEFRASVGSKQQSHSG